MVKLNSKRFLAVAMATVMVFGSSITAFAENEGDGAGTYEGNEVAYDAPSVTLPTIVAGTFNYIADPNGLIKESNSSRYSNATWADAKGVFFETETNKYTDTSAPIAITNKAAYAIDVVVTMAQKEAGQNVTYNTDNTFKDSTTKDLYLALSDGTTTSAMSQAAGTGAQAGQTIYKPAELRLSVAGKPSNYQLVYSKLEGAQSESYHYEKKSTVKDTDWNSASITATGALNMAAAWNSGADTAEIKYPKVTVTFAITAGAAPVKIQNGVEASVNLTHKATSSAVSVSKIAFGATEVPSTMYTTSTPTANTALTLTLKEGFTSFAYDKVPADGLNFSVTYNDGFVETITILKR